MENAIGLEEVKAVYNGPEAVLWKLIMGEQIHIGGLKSSLALANAADVCNKDKTGVDLCCCAGAGMRFLVRFCGASKMTGVDASSVMVANGKVAIEEEGLSDKIELIEGDAIETGLESGSVDLVWGEDAWCYVENKEALIAEAARLVKSGGTVAFTDWVEGPAGLTEEEKTRFTAFMKFPNVQSINGYKELLTKNGLTVKEAKDTGNFGPHVDLYLNMLNMQFTYDALKIIGWCQKTLEGMAGEMMFMQELAHAGKIAQGLFVATKE